MLRHFPGLDSPNCKCESNGVSGFQLQGNNSPYELIIKKYKLNKKKLISVVCPHVSILGGRRHDAFFEVGWVWSVACEWGL